MCTEWSFTSGSQSAARALLRNEQRKVLFTEKQKRPVLVALRVGDDAAVLLSEEKQGPF